MYALRFEPYRPAMDPAEAIVVGGSVPAALHLSQWPGNATPPALKADTSLEIALKFLNLKTPRREGLRRGAEIVTSPAFGVDALLALWALTAPQRAQGFTGPLQAAAFSGAYQVFVFPEATKICCAVNRLGDPERSRLGADLGGADPWERLGVRYRALLPLLDELFGYVDRFEGDWREEYEAIQADRDLFATPQVKVEEFPEVDLAVLRTPRPLHPVARNSATDRLRVLTIVGETIYEVMYRAESWMDVTSRPVATRIDLGPLVPELQGLESGGTWRWDGIAQPVPALQCAGAAGRPAPSTIPPDRFIATLRAYLATHAENATLHWNPRSVPKILAR